MKNLLKLLNKRQVLTQKEENLMGRLFKKEEHATRFFGTTWSSRLSLKRWHSSKLKKSGLYFYNGYVELQLGKWVLKYRNNK